MVYQVRPVVYGQQRATCNRRVFVAAGLIGMLFVFSVVWTVLAIMHYTDPRLAEQNYCQQNKFRKEQLGQEDVLDTPNSICNSSILLEYTVEQLEPPLRAAYLSQAVTGAVLTAAAPPALVGALLGQRRWLLVWAVADVIWCSTLVGSAAVLAPFGFPTLVPMLAGSAAAYVLLGCLVLYCGLTKPDGQEHSDGLELSDQDLEQSEQDPERGEQDPERGEEETKIEESMSSRV